MQIIIRHRNHIIITLSQLYISLFSCVYLRLYDSKFLGLEESSNAPLEGKAGVSTPVATAWIAATGAVVATVTAPPAVKMKLGVL